MMCVGVGCILLFINSRFSAIVIEDNVFLFALVTGFGIYLSSRYTSGSVPFSFPEHHEKSTRARGKGDPILFTVAQFFGGAPF